MHGSDSNPYNHIKSRSRGNAMFDQHWKFFVFVSKYLSVRPMPSVAPRRPRCLAL